ncbi:hypothetical protein Cycma_2452 [Cyclobacterium marinum DSM 745]|uniref:GIY-YIG domain-containing protein n=2 Tax=Cyclobacterium marinum TaxID=104 RepID=G0IUX0_CYCMS|nr:hypothetical protein Cycma_2452 [Cyclobacterium marinum DSM 745]
MTFDSDPSDLHRKGRGFESLNSHHKPFRRLFLFMHCHFYILFSRCKNRYYIRATCDELKERVRRYNSNHKKGFTGTVNDWELVYSEDFKSKEEAFSREREVKKWKSRKKIETLISST